MRYFAMSPSTYGVNCLIDVGSASCTAMYATIADSTVRQVALSATTWASALNFSGFNAT
ncbi:hypothetical protein ACWT_2489 [Actinoplanes sp. SE50]|nr:hypothetical protein ACPL_3057 [Actinoplanes sp. SE50/110]ATO81904.1 hypothetical protein ACWT_2489 [Actinoplanes sp. SE50]SLL99312.1 hypothetical protein ACSP50_2543 [Actinoplanes sp. SE50/110]